MMDKIYSDYVWGFPTNSVFNIGGLDINYDCVGKSIFRLMNHLGFNPYGIFHGSPNYSDSNNVNPSVFPMMAMAYQAIFQDYFRIEDYELRNTKSFNADWQYDQQSAPTHMFELEDGLFALRYRPRHKDYFTSVKVSPMTSATNLLNVDNTNVSQILSQVDSFWILVLFLLLILGLIVMLIFPLVFLIILLMLPK